MCVCLCPQLALADFSQLDLQPCHALQSTAKMHLCASYGLVFMAHLLRRTGKSFSMTVMCHVRVYVCAWSATSDGPNSARTPTRTVTHHAQHSHALAEPPGRKKKRPQTASRVAGRTVLAQPHTSTTNILSLFSHNSTNTPLFALLLAAKMQLCVSYSLALMLHLLYSTVKSFLKTVVVSCVCACVPNLLSLFSHNSTYNPCHALQSTAKMHLCTSYGLVFMSHLLRRTGKSFSMTVMCHVRVYVCVWSSTSDGPNSARTPTRTVTHHAQHSHALAEPPGRKKKRPQTAGRVAGRTALAQPHTSTTNILSLFSHNSTNTPLFALQLAAKMQSCASYSLALMLHLLYSTVKSFLKTVVVSCVCACVPNLLSLFSHNSTYNPCHALQSTAKMHLCASYGLVFMSHLLRRTGKSFSMTVMCHVRVYVCVWSSTSDGPNSARTPTRTVTHHAQHSHALAEPPGRKKKRPQTASRVAGRTVLAQPHTSTTNILSLFSHNSTNTPLFALLLAAKMQLCVSYSLALMLHLLYSTVKSFLKTVVVSCVCACVPNLLSLISHNLTYNHIPSAAKHSKDAPMCQLWPGVHGTFVAAHWQKFLYDRHVSCACVCVCVVGDLRRTQLGANTNPDRNTPRTTLTRTR